MKDLIIIGGGPAGLTAGIYAGRYKLDTAIITKIPGGMAATAHKICNFPSYKDISGPELVNRMVEQVESLNIPIFYDAINSIEKKEEHFSLTSENGEVHETRTIIFAVGTEIKKLNIPSEDKFLGKGLSYCATCDGPLFKSKSVAVIGGGNAAVTTAQLMAEYAKEVYVINRKEKFERVDPVLVETVSHLKNITFIFKEEISEIQGDRFVSGLTLKSGKHIDIEGIFVEIGSVPNVILTRRLGIIEKDGYLVVNQLQETNVPGFYAAGDVTYGPLKQIVTAASQGAVAAHSVYQRIKSKK
jgi:thioredoxin reductase (NADPH)